MTLAASYLLSQLMFAAVCSAANITAGGSTPDDRCGVSKVSRPAHFPTLKITEGDSVQPGEFPWAALVGWTLKHRVLFGCGGSLITDRHVLTAAHCLDGKDVVKVRLGGVMREPTGEDKDNMKELDVAGKIIHEYWNTMKQRNDIGLVKLKDKVTFNDFIRPACIPPPETYYETYYGEYTVTAGWGLTEAGVPSDKLLKVKLQVPDQGKCKGKLLSADYQAIIDRNVICAGGEGGKDSCGGDSGGPLMWMPKNSSDRKWYLIGLVSWGDDCGLKGSPGVYTRIVRYTDWIAKHIAA